MCHVLHNWEERRTRRGRRSMNNRRVVTLEGYWNIIMLLVMNYSHNKYHKFIGI